MRSSVFHRQILRSAIVGQLKVLPAQLANMIAAGEVVQRPASVVKELLENSIDAGAGKINVILKDAGRTLIQVIDDGCGMTPSDAVLCFERHATSKISDIPDLENILTYGFRGEALASMAAVSEITLRTRRADADTAAQVKISPSSAVTSSEVAAPKGTSFAIRNLFFNTPARRKFLKNDSVELRHCTEEFTRVAITHPDIEFTLTHNDKDLFVLRKAKSIKFRVLDLLGSTVTGDLIDLDADTSTVKVSGFVGRPEKARKTLGNQYFFVNGRFFRSAYLHKAVMKAYEDLIPEGVTPSYFIFLQTDPSAIDVNIHPSKTEVKFEDDSLVFQIVSAAVKATLGRNSFGADIDFDLNGAVEMPQIGNSYTSYKGGDIAPSVDFDTAYDPFQPESRAESDRRAESFNTFVEKGPGCEALFDDIPLGSSFLEEPAPVAAVQPKLIVADSKYIVVPVAGGILAVNILRARERILYEHYLQSLAKDERGTQVALFPVRVQVGVQQRILLGEHAAMLLLLGFDISEDGNDAIVVNGLPEGYSCEKGKVERLIMDILLILSDDSASLPELMQSSMAAKFATLGAVNAEPPANASQAQMLLDALFSCSNSEVTASGRRIATLIPTSEIDKKF